MYKTYSKSVLFWHFGKLNVSLRSISVIVVLCSISVASYSQTITTFAGNGSTGYSGDGVQATAATLYEPTGVAIDASGNVYIADEVNFRVRMVNTSGIISTIAGNGYTSAPLAGGYSGDGGPATAAEINNSYSIAVDASGNVYIADEGNNRIREVNTSGIINTFAGTGNQGYTASGPATAANLYSPYGVAVDTHGNVYVVNEVTCVVQEINTSGNISTIAGNGYAGYSGDGGAATAADLFYPYAVAVDASENVYIGDDLNQRVRIVNTSGTITTIAGNGIQGSSGDGGPATAAEIDGPQGVVVDASGNVYITSRDGLSPNGPKIRLVNTSGIISTYAGTGSSGYSGDGGPATAADLSAPWGLAVDVSGNLYIADEFNNRVRKVTITTFTVSASVTANVSCNGTNTGSASATVSNGTSPYTYSWSPGGATTSTVSGLSAGTYTITAMDNTSSTATASVDITQPAALSTTASTTANVSCYGEDNGSASASSSGGTSPYTYSWSPGGATTSAVSGLSAGSYTITATDNNGCIATVSIGITQPASSLAVTMAPQTNVLCYGDNTGSATANTPTGGTIPYTYSWSPSGGTNFTASNLSAGTYTITATDNSGCTATASVNIIQPASPLAVTMGTPMNVLCNGGNTGSAAANTPTGGTSPYTYSWSSGGGTNLTASNLSAGAYTITATDSSGCIATASVSITQPNALIIDANGPSVCPGQQGTLTSNVSGGTQPYTYSWTPGGGNASTLVVTTDTTATYTLTVTDANGCTKDTGITITVVPVPVPVVSGTQTICSGSPVTLSASGGATYSWSNGATTSTITVSPASNETYSVTVANGSCTATDSVKVIVNSAPSGTACCDETIDMGENATLSVSPVDTGSNYNWTPPTGLSCTNCPNPIASPTVTTTYSVMITNSDGCSKTSSLTITVKENCGTVFIPNVFSPNGDGQNDVLYVMGNCITNMDFIIYDRWGNKVFESTDQGIGWDGRYKGQPMNIGTYVYYFTCTALNNQIITKKGTVTLVR